MFYAKRRWYRTEGRGSMAGRSAGFCWMYLCPDPSGQCMAVGMAMGGGDAAGHCGWSWLAMNMELAGGIRF